MEGPTPKERRANLTYNPLSYAPLTNQQTASSPSDSAPVSAAVNRLTQCITYLKLLPSLVTLLSPLFLSTFSTFNQFLLYKMASAAGCIFCRIIKGKKNWRVGE